jgi:hypothetical protein
VSASLQRSVTALDELLVRPLGLTGRVVLVTTGALGQLPWASLPSLRSVPVVVAPSATAWLTASAGSGSGHGVVAIAGPDLTRSGEEITAVASQVQAISVAGAEATRAVLTDALGSAAIVHIAAHGIHQTENPLFSSLRLADGPLFAHELDASSTVAEHVVLSACELGLATVRPGDEALGLTSVLLQLGTRCVIGGVARVSDDVAATTMATYYRELAGGRDTAEALALALAAPPLADQQPPAPFVCFGAARGWAELAAQPAIDPS